VLRLVSRNAGDLVSTELLAGLWNAYSLSHRQNLPATSTAGGPASNNNNSSSSSKTGTIKSLLRSSKKTLKSGKTNEHHVVDMNSPPNFEDV